MNSIDGPFLKSSTLTYRTEAGFGDDPRPVFLFAPSLRIART